MNIFHKHSTQRGAHVFRWTFTITGWPKLLGSLLLLAVLSSTVQAASVTLAWNRSANLAVTGYRIYYWDASVAASNVLFAARMVSVGNVTNATVTNLVVATTYTFAATSVDTTGLESAFSSQVTYKIPTNAVVVTPPNQPPTLTALAALAIKKNAGPQTVKLTGITSGSSKEVQTLTITAKSSNTNLISTPTVIYTSPNTNGTLSFAPVTNATGTATITVTVNDGAASNNLTSQSFTVAVGLATVQAARAANPKQFMLTVTGQSGQSYDIQATTDFKTWTVIGTVTVGVSGTLNFTDTNAASYSRRFYRTRG